MDIQRDKYEFFMMTPMNQTHTKRTYLDYNATTPIRPEVVKGVCMAMETIGNPSSIHHEGRQARKLIEQARAQVAELVGAQTKQVIFTSGATEANNMVLKGYASHRRLLVSATEHPSVLYAGVDVETIPVHSTGLINLDALKELLDKDTRPSFVSIMAVNNETGVIQPLKDIATLLKNYECLFHSDAVQAVGRIPLYFSTLNVDFMSLSAHKIGGPHGVGAIIMGKGTNPPKLIHGGGQERQQRAGTENVAGIYGFGIAAACALNGLETYKNLETYRDQLEATLKNAPTDVIIHGHDAPRVPNTISASIAGFEASTLLMNLDLAGISVSTGSACSSGSVQASHVLTAMGATESQAKSGLRLSMGWATTQDDIDAFTQAWTTLMERLTPSCQN